MYNVQETRNLILDLLKSKNKTTSQMLKDLGYNNSLLLDMGRKNTMPSADKIGHIADYLNVSVDYLLGRTNCPDIVVLDENGEPIIASITTSTDDKEGANK